MEIRIIVFLFICLFFIRSIILSLSRSRCRLALSSIFIILHVGTIWMNTCIVVATITHTHTHRIVFRSFSAWLLYLQNPWAHFDPVLFFVDYFFFLWVWTTPHFLFGEFLKCFEFDWQLTTLSLSLSHFLPNCRHWHRHCCCRLWYAAAWIRYYSMVWYTYTHGFKYK